MIGGQRPAQRRVMSSLPEEKGLQKTSTYIVPCFLFVEVSVSSHLHWSDVNVTSQIKKGVRSSLLAFIHLQLKGVFVIFGLI